MAEKKLLFFSRKDIATRSKLTGGGSECITPTPKRQGERLSPKFQKLFDYLESQKALVQQSATGIEPEQVLVFETIGRVEDFVNAVSKIEGFEWLGEIEIDEIKPDDGFLYSDDPKKKEKDLSGRLYLIFTNLTAMNQLQSLWDLWLVNPNFDCRQVKYRGKGKFKEVFRHLKDIRKWDVEDRFEESNVRQFWEENLQINPNEVVRFEIELWYRSKETQRSNSFSSVRNLITTLKGNVITVCDIPEISYHAILAELPADEIRTILSNMNTELVKCNNIMFFRPSGQIIMGNHSEEEILYDSVLVNNAPLPIGEPIVAIFDGYPLNKHSVLNNRLIIDDPDNIETHYKVEDRKHGTAMCSLIVRGDLNTNEEPLSTPLYVRPIMRPNESDRNKNEFVPNDGLILDTMHRAVKRIFEGEGEQEAVAPSIKIINLSIGDNARLFYNSMSPWSKLLDWLSYKYRVLFIISTGNHNNEIHLNISKIEFESLKTIEKESIFLQKVIENRRNTRIMSPAESINNITVGALHIDNASFYPNERRLNPYTAVLPGTYTALGGGYRRSIKPDLVYYGGRQMFDYQHVDSCIFKPSFIKSPPGLKVASPDSTLNNTIHEIGTSNATALISRFGHFCYQELRELTNNTNVSIPSSMMAVLIKAMLIHGCSWDEIGEKIEERLNIKEKREVKTLKSKFLGYGFPDINKVKECTEQRATIIGFGELGEEEAHIYNLPLPPSLASLTEERRLTITLAWFSPISPTSQRYRSAKLWFDAKNELAYDRINADNNATRRGTLQHEVFEGNKATAFIDGDTITIKINCSKDANKFKDKIPYSLIVSLEVAEEVGLPIYQEIKDRISIPIIIQQPIL